MKLNHEEMKQKLITEFVNKVLHDNGSFELQDNEYIYHFMRDKIGKAEYIYGIDEFISADVKSQNGFANVDNSPKLVAIVSNEFIYIVSYLFCYIYNKDRVKLPQNCMWFTDYVEELNNYYKMTILPLFYDDLETEPIKDEKTIEHCKIEAHRRQLTGKCDDKYDGLYLPSYSDKITQNEVAGSLCGLIDIDVLMQDKLQYGKEFMCKFKRQNEYILSLIETSTTVELYEIDIANALNGIKDTAKTLNVEFTKNGKVGTGKISPAKVIDKLVNNDYFSEYDFANTTNGEILLMLLEVPHWAEEKEKYLYTSDITKITYGRKIIYSREQEQQV